MVLYKMKVLGLVLAILALVFAVVVSNVYLFVILLILFDCAESSYLLNALRSDYDFALWYRM